MSLDGTPYINHHKVLKKAPAVPSMGKTNATEHHQPGKTKGGFNLKLGAALTVTNK